MKVPPGAQPITIVLKWNPVNGDLEIGGPMNSPVILVGILELAKHAVLSKAPEAPSNIVIPTLVQKRPM